MARGRSDQRFFEIYLAYSRRSGFFLVQVMLCGLGAVAEMCWVGWLGRSEGRLGDYCTAELLDCSIA